MPCEKCAEKLKKQSLACSQPKLNSKVASVGASKGVSDFDKRKSTNKLLSKRYSPYAQPGKVGSKTLAMQECKKCRKKIDPGKVLCHCESLFVLLNISFKPLIHYYSACSSSNGLCAMCGKSILDKTPYKMSSKWFLVLTSTHSWYFQFVEYMYSCITCIFFLYIY